MAVVAKDPTTEAPPAEDLAEVSLPTGMTADELAGLLTTPESEAEPEDQKPEDRKPEPEAPTPPAPAPPPVTPQAQAPDAQPERKGDLRKALREERGKRKKAEERAQTLWEEIKKERKQGAERLNGRPTPELLQPDPKDAARLNDLVRQAEEAEASGKGFKPIVESLYREAQRLAQETTNRALATVLPNWMMNVQEQQLRESLWLQGENYDELLKEAGVFESVRGWPQACADPIMARRIYGSANPAQTAYLIAKGKLAEQSKSRRDDDDEHDDDPLPNLDAKPNGTQPQAISQASSPAPAAPAAAPTAEAVAEARRAGAREVAESVAHNTKRPQGVRLLRDAGQPVRVGRNLTYWNALKAWMDRAERNPMGPEAEKFLQYMQANPEDHQFLMAGPPKA